MKTDSEKLEQTLCIALQECGVCIGGECGDVCQYVKEITKHFRSKGVTIPVRCGECKHFCRAELKLLDGGVSDFGICN